MRPVRSPAAPKMTMTHGSPWFPMRGGAAVGCSANSAMNGSFESFCRIEAGRRPFQNDGWKPRLFKTKARPFKVPYGEDSATALGFLLCALGHCSQKLV